MDPLLILAAIVLLSRGAGTTTTRHVGDIVINSFTADSTETVTSPRSSFKVKLTSQGPGIIQQFRGDPTADFIAVYGRATG